MAAHPGISAQPEHHADVHASAEWFAEAAREVGFPTVEIWPTPGCRRCSPNGPAPTRTRRPCSSTATTTSNRSTRSSCGTPTRSSRRRRRRAAGPRRVRRQGPAAVPPARPARPPGRHRADRPAVNLKLLIEGEEESGSPNFAGLLDEHRERLDCDVVVITDTGMIAPDSRARSPACAAWSVATVDFHGPDLDLHSGVFGGAVPNPATALARLVARAAR